MTSIDMISYDPQYVEAVRRFEKLFGGLVYHAVESITSFGKMLSLLYVGRDEVDWLEERPEGGTILTYIVNLDNLDLSEFGYISLGGINGVLVRIG